MSVARHIGWFWRLVACLLPAVALVAAQYDERSFYAGEATAPEDGVVVRREGAIEYRP